jgi:hypothetical protein
MRPGDNPAIPFVSLPTEMFSVNPISLRAFGDRYRITLS